MNIRVCESRHMFSGKPTHYIKESNPQLNTIPVSTCNPVAQLRTTLRRYLDKREINVNVLAGKCPF